MPNTRAIRLLLASGRGDLVRPARNYFETVVQVRVCVETCYYYYCYYYY